MNTSYEKSNKIYNSIKSGNPVKQIERKDIALKSLRKAIYHMNKAIEIYDEDVRLNIPKVIPKMRNQSDY